MSTQQLETASRPARKELTSRVELANIRAKEVITDIARREWVVVRDVESGYLPLVTRVNAQEIKYSTFDLTKAKIINGSVDLFGSCVCSFSYSPNSTGFTTYDAIMKGVGR